MSKITQSLLLVLKEQLALTNQNILKILQKNVAHLFQIIKSKGGCHYRMIIRFDII